MKSKRRTQTIISIITIFTLFSSTLFPALQAHAQTEAVQLIQNKRQTSNVVLPPFPEDKSRPSIDWSTVNWDKEIILEKDREAYFKQVEELERQGKYDEIETLQPKKTVFRVRLT
jgi:hypothetical protein